ncbi:hypothetical protein KKJ04_22070 [Xenorhabdus bovienii]|uniref:hypothetical protein n=1 Tax=Xenorhabdus bovienii TaxID=40576 RepID=UPI0023B2AEE8|nr:hypothetical protein [Xenorhabdus bovienii]MDE9448120.1 hypothetical protein [Xenorhabdus bovienii]
MALLSPFWDFFDLAINQIAKTGLSSLQVIYYFENLFRVYDICTVYSSFGPSISSNLVFQNDTVNYFTISRYMNNKGHDGLFVVITGTNDPTDKTKVPFGSTVTLTLRIDSYKVPVYKTFTQTMPTKSDGNPPIFHGG